MKRKRATKKLPQVIRAPQELVEKMKRFSVKRGITFEQMKAQVDAQLRSRNDSPESNVVRSSGRGQITV